MSKDEIRKAMKEKRVAKAVGKNPIFGAAALNGNHKFTADEAKKIGGLIGLDAEPTVSLRKFPARTDFPNTTDPFLSRLQAVKRTTASVILLELE